MIKGVQNVIELLEQNRCPYWQIKAAPKDVVKTKDESKDSEENYTMLQSMPFLRNQLERLEAGKYWIDFWDNPTSKNTRLGEWFIIESKDNNQSIQGLQQPVIDIKEEIKQAVASEREKWETTEKINQLEKEINEHKQAKLILEKELKQAVADKDDVWTRVANKVEPYLGAIIPAFLPKLGLTPAVAGGTDIHIEDTNDTDLTQRLEKAINIWQETEPLEEIIFLIEKIASMTKNNPSMYNTAKGILKA